LFLSWDKDGVGKVDGLIGEVTFDPGALLGELIVAETGVVCWFAIAVLGSASGA
jgi:hypothetical protein